MKKKTLYIILTVVFVVVASLLYYFYPRKVSFELVKEIEKPHPEFDRTFYVGFNYVEDAERLKFFMVYYYNKASCIEGELKGYSLIFVENLAKELNFDRYDYIITYQKKLKELRHSPYLTKTADDLYFDKRTPLIPTWDSVQTDNVYIYQIKKNSKFRAPGP